ncbi:hypothetical protein EMA8858_00647 [Emticicia aquatica]|uniref:DUF4249 domain-containing protein n=1 Tax=Emticicia aquatica TaxID=1681835 RepID=A0ABM9ALC4_9BACT|nr:DUF4249 domain-containing protein [Emticicia aquatica]CAH0994537.1 hypothetical protein EMA8858_00647 [Emticicia aquatica]
MKFLTQFFIAIFSVCLIACVDVFDPKLKGGIPSIVFEGTLTDQPGPHYFVLSFSAGYNSSESVFDKYVNAAKVWITDSKNIHTDLIDLNRGQFSTPDGFRGQIGNAYTLHVRTSDGVEYASNAETMRFSPPIEKVYTEYKPITTPRPQYRGTFNVFLDIKDPVSEGDYYRWTWKNYQKANYCEVYTVPRTDPPQRFFRKCCDDCWNITQCLGCVNVASDKLVNGRTLAKQNIGQIPYDDTSPYYILVEQMSLSKEAYLFWSNVKAQANNSGGIFDTAPATIRGNIKNLTDASKPMLGYFQVSAVKQKAVFIQRNNISLPPYSTGLISYPFDVECAVCNESPYRTARRPLDWKD